MNPYVFFVGCPRSGTTLLQRMGDAHPDLAVLGELHWIPRWWERRRGIRPDGTVTPELAQRVIGHAHFARLGLTAQQVRSLVQDGRPKHYAEFVTNLFGLHGAAKGKRLVGGKTPQYVLHLETLAALWPHLKIVHLIRDGRDVGLSILDWSKAQRSLRVPPWNEDPVMSTALFWESHVRLGREAGPVLGPDRYLELRYESLVADPELASRRLCDFLGLEYDPAMLRFHEAHSKPSSVTSAKKAWLPVTAGLRSWRGQMAPADIARFEAICGSLLEELGYGRATGSAHAASREELARVDRLRRAFVQDAHAQRESVPRAWEALAV
jgi:hypothetical protein